MGFRNLKKSGFAFRQNKKQNRICNKATLSRTATMLQLHPVHKKFTGCDGQLEQPQD